jgi:hypothetical protein
VGWRHGPSWLSVTFALIVLGIAGVVSGFDAAIYAEYGGREGSERAYHCTTLEDDRCVDPTTVEHAVAREPKLMSKLASVGDRQLLVGLGLVFAGVGIVGAAIAGRLIVARRHHREDPLDHTGDHEDHSDGEDRARDPRSVTKTTAIGSLPSWSTAMPGRGRP